LLSGATFFEKLEDGLGGADGLALGGDGLSPVAVALPFVNRLDA